MVRLYLLGFTHDLKGVVFSQRRGGKSATFWVPVDETFLKAVSRLEGARREQGAARGAKKLAALTPAVEEAAAERALFPAIGRSESRIPVSEIQQLLREGRNVETVAKTAKASRAWVERLAEPVLVERAGVVRLAQLAFMPRPRLGRSGLPLGQAIRLNLEERSASVATLETLEEGWDARATRSGPWRVRLRFSHRGRRVAEWDFVKSTRQITPRNRLASELGWWPPPEEPKRARTLEAEAEDEEEAAETPAKRKPKRGSAPKRRSAPERRSAPKRGSAPTRKAGR